MFCIIFIIGKVLMSFSILIMNKIFSLTLLLSILIQLNVCWGQVSNEKYRILVSGMQNGDMQIARDIISEKWGIELYPVATCMVSKELRDSIKKHNSVVGPLIAKKYGENWLEKFSEEIEIEFRRQLDVRAILDEADFIINKKAELEENGKRGFLYSMYPIRNSTEYNVSASIWGELEGESGWVSYYRLRVDHENKKITLLSDEMLRDQPYY